MTCPHRALLGLFVGCCFLVGSADGQVAGNAADLPGFIINANQLTESQKKSVADFVAQRVAELKGGDPAGLAKARNALIKQAHNPQAGFGFLDAYAEALNTGLAPLTEEQDMRVRLNAAIVAARVAERSKGVRLKEVVHAFVTDETAPVVLWGLRAAKHVLPNILANPVLADNDPILAAIVPAAREHDLGLIISEAYEVLRVGLAAGAKDPLPQGALAKVVPHVLDLLETRVERFRSSAPDTPTAENAAMQFLIDRRVWTTMAKEQKLRAAQAMVNLLGLTAAHANKQEGRLLETSLMHLYRFTATNIAVLAEDALKNPNLATAAHTARAIGVNTSATELTQMAENVYAKFKAVDGFKDLQPPAKLGQTQPAAQPGAAVPPNQIAAEAE